MKLRIVHRTSYRYDADVSANYNEVHLVPRSLPTQTCLSNELVIEPHPSDFHERVDYFGNGVAFFSVQSPHRALTVTATSTVEATDRPTEGEGWSGEPWEQSLARFADHADTELIEARPYVLDSPLVAVGERHAEYAAPSFTPGRPVLEAVRDLTRRIHTDFAYRPGATTIATELDDVLDQREGVCQDFAHVAIAAVRSMGLPARYVSGYLETLAPPGREKLTGVDASHAWFSVFAPGTGWVDFDPTNDRVPNERYVTTAWGRDYADVTPIKGIVFSSGGGHELTVAVDVVRLDA
jgi:transglutaminase-like putative cysteine protease